MEKLTAFKNDVKNGRIVEWWNTPDELALKVTAALHKQMDRKKRPGWVRGDSFNIEASHAEILNLNKLVRELQEENAELKSKIVERTPKIVSEFILDSIPDSENQNSIEEKSVEDEYRSHSNLVFFSVNAVYRSSSSLSMLRIAETVMPPLTDRVLIHISRIMYQMKHYVNIMKHCLQRMR
ncbi:hypothetical protein [Schaedlerella sp.]|uniref:hypothetical protein n=1 Tax=Schaedlerella sp. TaxID=2676057 RepID=UPI00272B9AA0|nr:hypothetical protein [uncultured Schaedlerella sp.]